VGFFVAGLIGKTATVGTDLRFRLTSLQAGERRHPNPTRREARLSHRDFRFHADSAATAEAEMRAPGAVNQQIGAKNEHAVSQRLQEEEEQHPCVTIACTTSGPDPQRLGTN
jgi:hypothetical protein